MKEKKPIKQILPDIYVREVKKGKFETVNSIKKEPEQKFTWNNIHWKNFLIGGSWFHILLFVLIILMTLAYISDTRECFELLEDPVTYCHELKVCSFNYSLGGEVNLSELDLSISGDSHG